MNEDKKYNVIKSVAEKRKDKKRACVELDLSIRQVNRLIQKYQEGGLYDLLHRYNDSKYFIPSEYYLT